MTRTERAVKIGPPRIFVDASDMTFAQVLATGVAPRPNAPRAIYRIIVRDLLLMVRIGIYEHERLAPQRVRINVDLAVAETVTDVGDDIANVYNYEDVIAGTKAIIAAGHIDLVETLAERIAAHCLKDARVEDVRVRVEKLDVYADAVSVGIEIERIATHERAKARNRDGGIKAPAAVVKLGGSLASGPHLKSWLEQLVRADVAAQGVVIVPGGGPFADAVRGAQAGLGFSDATAHRLALGAMNQYARIMADLEPRLVLAASAADLGHAMAAGRSAVWLPASMADADPTIPVSWDVTSDSLAAWLAQRLGAPRLMVVKSAPLPSAPVDIPQLVDAGLVDRAFGDFVKDGLRVELVEAGSAVQTVAALASGAPVGLSVP